MLWGVGIKLYRKYGNPSDDIQDVINNRILNSSIAKFFSLEEVFEYARTSTKYILIITALLAVMNLINGIGQSFAVIISTFAAVFIGMAVGTAADSISHSPGKYINGAIVGSFAMSLLITITTTSIDGSFDFSLWQAPLLIVSFFGSIIGMIGKFILADILQSPSSNFMYSPARFQSRKLPFKEQIQLQDIRSKSKIDYDGLKFTVEVVIQNHGDSITVYPEIEFKVAKLKDGKFITETMKSPSTWTVYLTSTSQTTLPFTWILDSTTKPLIESPNKIDVRFRKQSKSH